MIQEFSKDNLNLCAEMFFDVFTSPPWEYTWLSRENINRYFEDMLITPGFIGFLYYEGHTCLGVCLGGINDYFIAPQFEINEIFINRNRQKEGIGSKMLAEIETCLSDAGVHCVTLLTQKDMNAYQFYLKNGYSVSKKAVHMSKILSGDQDNR